MDRVLQLVDDVFGGSTEWLSSHGLTASELDRLRARIEPLNRRELDGPRPG
jgi:hypothetical protein